LTGEEGEETDVESPKIYEPIGSFKELSDRLEMHQQQYNESIRGAKMDLVFFKVGNCLHRSMLIRLLHVVLPITCKLTRIVMFCTSTVITKLQMLFYILGY